MIYAAAALRQVADLRDHYERLQRPEASAGLRKALLAAERRIEARPRDGLPAPRPYPALAHPGEAWVKVGRYWVAYSLTTPPVILAVFYDAADIPGRG